MTVLRPLATSRCNMTVQRLSAIWRCWGHKQTQRPSATWRCWDHQQHDGAEAISNKTVQRPSATWRCRGQQQHDGTETISNMTALRPSATWRYWDHQQHDGTEALREASTRASRAVLKMWPLIDPIVVSCVTTPDIHWRLTEENINQLKKWATNDILFAQKIHFENKYFQ